MRRLAYVAACFLMVGCEVIEYHPYDARVTGTTGVNAKNICRIEKKERGKTSFRFAMISDTQRSYDETEDVVRHLNARNDIDFVIHGGDLADFGETKEFMWARDILSRLNKPYVCLLGNHDCLGSGRNVFLKIFGEENFAFTAGDVRFICLNTNALEYDYSHPVPDFNFIERQIRDFPEEAKRSIVVMHVPPYDVEFNNNVVRPFSMYLQQIPGLQFCLYGHNHHFEEKEFFGDGLMFYGCTCISDRAYFVVTVNEDGYEVEDGYKPVERCTF